MHSQNSDNSPNFSTVLRQFKPKTIKIRQVDITNRNLVKNHIKNLIDIHVESTKTDVLAGIASLNQIQTKQDSDPAVIQGF